MTGERAKAGRGERGRRRRGRGLALGIGSEHVSEHRANEIGTYLVSDKRVCEHESGRAGEWWDAVCKETGAQWQEGDGRHEMGDVCRQRWGRNSGREYMFVLVNQVIRE